MHKCNKCIFLVTDKLCSRPFYSFAFAKCGSLAQQIIFLVLERVSGQAYECGLVRSSDLQSDSYHKIRCREGMMIVRGKYP